MPAMITTVDNPYDPRNEFAAWYAWDVEHGYNTCAYLARVTVVSESFPEAVQDRQREQAIDEILKLHQDGLYKKLYV